MQRFNVTFLFVIIFIGTDGDLQLIFMYSHCNISYYSYYLRTKNQSYNKLVLFSKLV